MPPKSKKAMTLSINSLVGMIMALVILSMGIVLMRNFFRGAAELKGKIDTQTESKIAGLLAEGEPIAIPVNRKTIEPTKQSTFGLGILNIMQDSPEATFVLTITIKGFDRTNVEIPGLNAAEWLLYEDEPFTLTANEQKIIPILVAVPANARPGTYIFTITIGIAGAAEPYGIQKFYVEVP